MIITISGRAGSGKSTVAKIIAKKLGIKHYSIGDLMREMALERGIPLLELNKLAERDNSIDLELDNKLKDLGKFQNNFVVDGRLTAFFIPHAKARVFLDADEKTRAERILKDKRQHEKSNSLRETMESIEQREESERTRYRQYYDVDYSDRKLYNFVVDTSKINAEEVAEKILIFINEKS